MIFKKNALEICCAASHIFSVKPQYLVLIRDILCPVSHICSKNLLETKDPTNQSTKLVCYKFKPSQSLHFKYSVLRLTYAGKT